MINKQGLLDLVTRAQRGALLDGEATILRDAIELLDDMAMTLDKIVTNAGALGNHPGFAASDTGTFRAVIPDDTGKPSGRTWPSCVCTPSWECGACWERRQ